MHTMFTFINKPSQPTATIANSLHNKSVFYIGNNVMNFTLFRLVLEQYRVHLGFDYWSDGSKTLNRLEAFMPVNLVLLELRLAYNDSGFDAYDTIRSHPRFDQIPVAAIGTKGTSVDMETARSKGFVGYIGKPLGVSWLSWQIIDLLEGKQVWYGL